MKIFKLKRIMLAIILSVFSGFGFFNAQLAYAVLPVEDIAAIAKLGEEYTEMVEQGKNIFDQLKQLEDQTAHLSHSILPLNAEQYKWSNEDVLSLMAQIHALMEQYSKIAYSGSDLDAQFKAHFPGYVPQDDYQEQYKTNANETLNTINGSLQSIGMNTNDFASESSRLSAIHDHVKTASGQTQAIQAMSEVSEEIVTQTQSLRQIVAAQTNSVVAYEAYQVQKEAGAKANLNEVIMAGQKEAPEYGSQPEEDIHLPF